MQALAIHTEVLTGRQIRKTLQGRLASTLATLQTAYFATDFSDVLLAAPGTDSYWTGPLEMEAPPPAFFATPSIGIQWSESLVDDQGGDVTNAWLVTTEYRIVIATTAPTIGLAHEVSQAYASAVTQVLSANLIWDAQAAVASTYSLGQSIPVRDVRPVGTAVSMPAEFDQHTEVLHVAEVILAVTQKQLLQ